MNKRGGISKNKLASRPLRGAAAAGLAAGLAAASLGGVPTASATCIGISGFNINFGDGGGCVTTVGGFALGLGPNTLATSAGLLTSAIAIGLGNEPLEQTQAVSFGFFNFSWAGGPDTFAQTNGNANLAVVQGENAKTVVGAGTAFDNLNIGINVGRGFDTGVGFTLDRETNAVGTFGPGNIAVNFFGNSIPGVSLMDRATWSVVRAGGGSFDPLAIGFANAAYNLFGNGNQVTVGNLGSNFGLGFSVFGNRNDVVVNGPAAGGGALFRNNRFAEQTGPGIEIGGVENPAVSNTNVLAAGGTQASVPKPSLNSTPGVKSTSTSPGGPVLKSINQLQSSAKKFGDQLAVSNKKFGDQLAVSNKKFGDQLAASNKKFRDSVAASNKKFGDSVAAVSKKFGDSVAAVSKKLHDSVNATRAGAKTSAATTDNSDK